MPRTAGVVASPARAARAARADARPVPVDPRAIRGNPDAGSASAAVAAVPVRTPVSAPVALSEEATPLAAADDVPAFDRLQAARRAGERLLEYLRKPGSSAPPIWNSPVVEARADRLRQDMHAAGRVRLADPQWRIGSDQAVLRAGVTVSDATGTPARLTATLRWRDGFWLVTALSMEAAP